MKQVNVHTLATSTPQSVFDFVAAHLLKQNKQCTKKGVCQYRLETGSKKKVLKCAAGCLIPRADYKPEFERKGWPTIVDQFSSVIPSDHQDLIRKLQCIHDEHSPSEWADKLGYLAIAKGLTTNF